MIRDTELQIRDVRRKFFPQIAATRQKSESELPGMVRAKGRGSCFRTCLEKAKGWLGSCSFAFQEASQVAAWLQVWLDSMRRGCDEAEGSLLAHLTTKEERVRDVHVSVPLLSARRVDTTLAGWTDMARL